MHKRMVILTVRHAFAYTFEETPKRLGVFETALNSLGVSSMSLGESPTLAIPGRTPGQVQLIQLSHQTQIQSCIILIAHTTTVACIQLSSSGKLLATASEKGTLIRVWDTTTSRLLNELRRGTDRALIYSIAFSSDESRLAVSSDKGTVHIFNLLSSENDPSLNPMAAPPKLSRPPSSPSLFSQFSGNRLSIFSPLSSYLPKYFSSEWSFASFSLPVESKCLVAFTRSDMASRYEKDPIMGPVFDNDDCGILALCADGSLYKFRFDPKKGGECVMESFYVFYRSSSTLVPHPFFSHDTSNGQHSISDEDGDMDNFWDDWEEDGFM